MQWSKHLVDPIINGNVIAGSSEKPHKTFNPIEMVRALLLV
jgi:hypothetical protein